MTIPKTRTIFGIGLSSLYLIWVAMMVSSSLRLPVRDVLFGANRILLGAAVDISPVRLNEPFSGITHINERVGFFLCGVAIILNGFLLYVIPRLIAKAIYDAPERDANVDDSR